MKGTSNGGERRVRTYSVPEAAAIIGISEPLLRAMIRQGQIHAPRLGRIYRVPERSIDKLLEGGDITA